MNRVHAQIFVDVLAFAGDVSESRHRLAQLSAADWEASLRWLDQGGLALYFWQRIEETGLHEAIPPDLRARFVERKSQNSIRTQTMLQEWRNFQQLFRSAALNCVVLKGLSKVPDYCPDPALRVQFDHDWLIDRNSLSRVHELLCAEGFQEKAIRERDRIVFVRRSLSRYGAWRPVDSYSQAIERPVEIHTKLWDCRNEFVQLTLPEDFLARSVRRSWGGDEFLSLGEEDVLLFEVLHAFRHVIHNWCRLSVFYELAHFLNRRLADKDFWVKVRARIESNSRLRQVTGIVLTLAASLFKLPEGVRALPVDFLKLTPASRLWVERYGIRSAMENFAADKFNLFLLGEFAVDRSAWVSLRRQRLFPIRSLSRSHTSTWKRENGVLSETFRRGLFLARRIGSHLYGSTSYAFEYPRWVFRNRRDSRKQFSSLPVTSLPKEVQHTDISASRLQGGSPVRIARG